MHEQRLSPAGFIYKPKKAAMKVDEIIYDAIKADSDLMAIFGGRVVSTCFEVPPTEDDNTPIPYAIITDDGFQNQQTTKDCVWEAAEDRVQATVEIAAASPREVQDLVQMVRRTVEQYIVTMYRAGEINDYDKKLQLESLSSDGLAWDWMKPCYFQRLTYSCIINSEV